MNRDNEVFIEIEGSIIGINKDTLDKIIEFKKSTNATKNKIWPLMPAQLCLKTGKPLDPSYQEPIDPTTDPLMNRTWISYEAMFKESTSPYLNLNAKGWNEVNKKLIKSCNKYKKN